MQTLNIGYRRMLWVVGVAIVATLAAYAVFAPATPAKAYSMLGSQMGIGSSGADVSALQTFLASNPMIYPQGLVTGYYGTLTAAAVVQFQIAHGIDPVGRVGPVTLARMNSLIASNLGLDISAPGLSAVSVSVSGQTATLSWNTSEAARGKVFYSTPGISEFEVSVPKTEPSISGTVWNDNTYSLAKTAVISGLAANTTYYYVVETIDGSGNVSVTVPATFHTN